ncbi:UNVERIFIED_CONTAM: hypothetical protein FKN15_072720 [Acipenser sinensis]
MYLSATGIFPSGRSDYEGPYDFGGVLTNSNRDILNGETVHKRNQAHKEMHCLHPGDLYPFTRKPLFVVVDSSNSVAYKNFTNLFGQPVVCLLSPTVYPKNMQGAPSNPCTDTKFLVLFQETRNYPETYPQLPKEETVENPMVQKHVLELASILDVQNLFCDNTLDDY